jgi:outer membrane assembly lipoprotein YfiO
MIRLRTLLLAIVMAGALGACQKHFDFALHPNSESIYRAALVELNEGSSYAAAEAFDRLTTQLSVRDSLLPKAYWYLGIAQMKSKEYLLSRNAFASIHRLFSTDTLADDGLLAAARAARKLWPNPELDSSYGEDAKGLLTTLIQAYPLTPLREEVFKELDALDDAFAMKEFEVARGLFSMKAWAPSKMILDQLIEKHPTTPTARKARIMLTKAYRKLKFTDDADEQCKLLRDLYRNDKEVLDLCGGAVAPPVAVVPP